MADERIFPAQRGPLRGVAIPVAVAQVKADKFTIAVRKVASIYLLWGVVQLVTVAVDLLATLAASREFEPGRAKHLQVLRSRVALATTLSRALKFLVKAFATPSALLYGAFGVRRIIILGVTFALIITIHIIHLIIPGLTQRSTKTVEVALRLDL